MLFAAYEKNMYQLLKEYLRANLLLLPEVPDAIYDRALTARAQEYGFLDLESYCRYVVLQPFSERTSEIRSIIMGFKTFSFYQNREQLEALSSKLLADTANIGAKKEEKKFSSKLFKILTSEVDFSHADESQKIKILSVECGYGHELYSVVMRVYSVLPEKTKMEVIATESNPDFLKKASDAKFPEPSVAGLGDNYRSLFMERTKDGFYQITNDLRRQVEIRKIDFLSDSLIEDYLGAFHLVFINSLHHFYPPVITGMLIEKIAPCVASGGLLFTEFHSGAKWPVPEGFEKTVIEKAPCFRKKGEIAGKPKAVKIDGSNDSPENQLAALKGQLMENRIDSAHEGVKQILKEHISHTLANHFLGDIYVFQKQTEKAISQYEKVLLINPLFAAARFNIAVLNLMGERRDEAEKQILKIEEKIELTDFNLLKSSFNVSKEGFINLLHRLKSAVKAEETVTPALVSDWVSENLADIVEAPSIKVPDKYGTALLDQQEETPANSAEEKPADDGIKRKVVNISELPSSRDYGKHDPWAKKKAEEEDIKRKADEFNLLHEDYRETIKGKSVSLRKSRKKAESPSKKPGWVDLTDEPVKEKRKPVKMDKPPKSQVIVKTKKKSD